MNDDIRLARRAGAGDRDAFELLVRRHTDGVWRYARPRLAAGKDNPDGRRLNRRATVSIGR